VIGNDKNWMRICRSANPCLAIMKVHVFHGWPALSITCNTPGYQRHHRIIWGCSTCSDHSTEKPIASTIFPWDAMA
jgi:hypothetical protein